MNATPALVAYTSQFLDSVRQARRTKANAKAQLISDGDPEKWDLPLKPKRMRGVIYEEREAKFGAAEDAIEACCGLALARLMKPL